MRRKQNMINKKIDFAIIIGVKNANPNGDPLNGNRPRVNYDGFGEISDVCLKRKIRNRLMDDGEDILVQSDDYRNDTWRSIKDRFDNNESIASLGKKSSSDDIAEAACKEWFDVRAFGQILSLKGKRDKEAGGTIAIRGPVSIQSAFSIDAVDVESLQITKSVNLETNESDPSKKASDTIGQKHRISRGVYVTYGSINRQLAEKTHFSDEDAEKLKKAILKLFENDESSARPSGSMEVIKVIWWTHTDQVVSSAKVHRSLKVNNDGTYTLTDIAGVKAEELDGQ